MQSNRNGNLFAQEGYIRLIETGFKHDCPFRLGNIAFMSGTACATSRIQTKFLPTLLFYIFYEWF